MKMKDFTKVAVIAYFVSILACILNAIIESIYNISPMKLDFSEYLIGLLYMPVFVFPYIFALGLIISYLVNKIIKSFYLKLCIYILYIYILSLILTPIIPLLKLNYAKMIFFICLLLFVLLMEKFGLVKPVKYKH